MTLENLKAQCNDSTGTVRAGNGGPGATDVVLDDVGMEELLTFSLFILEQLLLLKKFADSSEFCDLAQIHRQFM